MSLSKIKTLRQPLNLPQTVSWIHIGDTHITHAGEQNEIDLGRIVDEINVLYANSGIDFVFVPGDIADDGSVEAYEVFHKHMDRLKLPWFGIVGDHDVHEKSFDSFREYVASQLYSAFTIGSYRMICLNAFSVPRPDSFDVDEKQLQWLETELQRCVADDMRAVLFLHCSPSELKRGSTQLAQLLSRYPILLVDMGHTHYNEISNDGDVLYRATRSTGQIEEGPVGYSVTTLDGNSVSWQFMELGMNGIVSITSPVDERLCTSRTASDQDGSTVILRTKAWSSSPIQSVRAKVGVRSFDLNRERGVLWSVPIETTGFDKGSHVIEVTATGADSRTFSASIRFKKGKMEAPSRAEIDHQNAVGEWKERGILGTQLGPNKNGRKW